MRKRDIKKEVFRNHFLSTPEVAEMVGVFHTTIRRWVEKGKIKGIRVGRNYKIPIMEAIRFLKEHDIPLPDSLHRLTRYKHEKKGIHFFLDERQAKKYHSWKEKHDTYCPLTNGRDGAIGGRTTFTFTPTGLGEVVTARCGCKEGEYKVDLSFSEDW